MTTKRSSRCWTSAEWEVGCCGSPPPALSLAPYNGGVIEIAVFVAALGGAAVGWVAGKRAAAAQYRIYDAAMKRQIAIMWKNMADQAKAIKALSEDTMSAEILPEDLD